ncbi:hypothetical protein MTR67_007194 [Solanum verrucosum]|uniref:Uncharacterized protein n=1 Tax=Solanum verrucosum TaxID=315347 RepID=A0AAF0TCV8_SOLVR|nr:hypothetical protein MTR67_007185 [Solanum verrucosum]WMV13809.1 hypothetical protein MTR67_007194 [Solanum verrucosum]
MVLECRPCLECRLEV